MQKNFCKKISAYILFSILILSGCTIKKIDSSQITVSILPQKYFVEKIAGDDFKINVMIPSGQSPATYEPVAEQIKKLSISTIYFRIGWILFEKIHMESFKTINSKMKIINTSKGINLIQSNHNHGDNHSNNNGIDPHVWLSPNAVKIITKNIYKELIKLKPEKAAVYKKRFETFIIEIDKLDKSFKLLFKERLKNNKNRFIVFHPSWAYFARDYNLKQIPIEVEGKEPGPKQIKNIIDKAKQKNIKVIFIQRQFPIEVALSIAGDIKGKVIQLDPLEENWIENLKKIAAIFNKEM